MILAIETSTPRASLAVYDRERACVVAEKTFTTERAHNAAIFAPLQELIAAYREQLAGIVVGLGPGSYGGVRVGIAVANGLSVAMDLPVVGCCSLEGWEAASESYLVAGDARRGTFFLAVVKKGLLSGEPSLVPEAEVAAHLRPLLDEGLVVHSSDARVAEAIPGAVLSFPSAPRLAVRLRGHDFARRSAEALEPHYLRAPYITLPKARK